LQHPQRLLHNGLSVGCSLGAAFTKYKTAGILNASQSKTNFLLNVLTGYTKSFDNVIAGADLALNFEKISEIPIENSGSSFWLKNSTSLGISISPRIGYKFNETTASYFKLRLGYSRLDLPKNIKDVGLKPGMIAFQPTVGVEKFSNENVSVRSEVSYKLEKINTEDVSNAKFIVDSIKKNAVIATIGIVYTF
jgi:hypothetical protein